MGCAGSTHCRHRGAKGANALGPSAGGLKDRGDESIKGRAYSQNAGKSAMLTDWADKVGDVITNLEIKIDRVLEPDQALAIIAVMWWKES
jgi:hypothetical protein